MGAILESLSKSSSESVKLQHVLQVMLSKYANRSGRFRRRNHNFQVVSLSSSVNLRTCERASGLQVSRGQYSSCSLFRTTHNSVKLRKKPGSRSKRFDPVSISEWIASQLARGRF
jgi:hypothetical protein